MKVTSFADSTKLSMEATVLANATGFQVGRRGMFGPACGYVREMAGLLPAEQMLSTGLIDYALGAAPHPGAFVIVHEDSPLKKVQLLTTSWATGRSTSSIRRSICRICRSRPLWAERSFIAMPPWPRSGDRSVRW